MDCQAVWSRHDLVPVLFGVYRISKSALGHGIGMHFLLKPVAEPVLFLFQVEMRLQVQPELRRDAEIPAQAQRGVRSYASSSVHDLVDPPGRDADVARQTVLGNTHGGQKLLHENLAGMDGGHLVGSHDNSPSDNPRSLLHARCLLSI